MALAKAALQGTEDVTRPDGQPETHADPAQSAHEAGLRYVSDTQPGIRRQRAGKGFRYYGRDGDVIRDAAVLRRILSLAIPPAWRAVWICADPRGHIQATGRDARGRKQYRYHPRWRAARDETKYHRMVAFGSALPLIRERTARDLALSGLPRAKVLATVVQLLDTTLIRIGNEEYARENDSYGLTTLHQDHVEVSNTRVRFEFRGKSGKEHIIEVRNPRLARIVRRCKDLPGYELFQYLDENGERRTLDSTDVNTYLQEITGQDFTAKDFRTWGGTVIAAQTLRAFGVFESQTQARKNIVEAMKAVAAHLGNTPAISRKSYVNPQVLTAYLDGALVREGDAPATSTHTEMLHTLRPEELEVFAFLKRLDGQ